MHRMYLGRGQALVEFVIGVMVVVLFLVLIPLLGKLLQVRLKVVEAANYVVWEQAKGVAEDDAGMGISVGNRFFSAQGNGIHSEWTQHAELYIDKFLPDPFQPDVSYVDSTTVGNIDGFGGSLALYRPNGFDSRVHFCVNAGGALADTSWLAPGDVPMVSFHTVFDPFAPFTEGVVIVPTTGEQVLPLQGSNLFMELVNTYGNNSSFANLPNPGGEAFTARARSLYGTDQVHGPVSVHVNSDVEGLFPMVTPDWPGMAVAPLEPEQRDRPDGRFRRSAAHYRHTGQPGQQSEFQPDQRPRLHRHHHGLYEPAHRLRLGPWPLRLGRPAGERPHRRGRGHVPQPRT